MFEPTDGAWNQQVKLTPEDGESDDIFGRSVAIEDDTALVGTVEEDECTNYDLYCIVAGCGTCSAACYSGCVPCCVACAVVCPGALVGCCTNWETVEDCYTCAGTL